MDFHNRFSLKIEAKRPHFFLDRGSFLKNETKKKQSRWNLFFLLFV
jgi:hypothetical protein